jgi:hypothetical protein
MTNLKRVYEPASPEDGVRIFVERLWPRGIKRDASKPVLGTVSPLYYYDPNSWGPVEAEQLVAPVGWCDPNVGHNEMRPTP